MAIDPVTAKIIAKAIINQIADEEQRQKLIISIIVGIVIFLFIIMIPLFIIISPVENIKSLFSANEYGEITDNNYKTMVSIRNEYGYNSGKLIYMGKFPIPVEDFIKITAEYGYYDPYNTGVLIEHTGIDLVGKEDCRIISIADGEVVLVSYMDKGYGNYVIIKHITNDEVFYSLYGHMKELPIVDVGQSVVTGQVLGIQGTTGNSTGPHLHFEIRKSLKGNFVNPREYLFE